MVTPAAILTCALLAAAPHSYAQDSLITGVCEGSLTPIGVILPANPATDCFTPTVLRHGWRNGDPGTFVFLELPPCPDSWCRSLPTSDKLRCEILIGNPCCWLQDLQGRTLQSVSGTRMGQIADALRGRFDADTDRREGICHFWYFGNQARVLRVLIVEPASSRGRGAYRVLGGGRLFLRERQGKSDDIVGEMIPAPVPPE